MTQHERNDSAPILHTHARKAGYCSEQPPAQTHTKGIFIMGTERSTNISSNDPNYEEPFTIFVDDGYGNPLPVVLLRGMRSLQEFLDANATPIEYWQSLYVPPKPKKSITKNMKQTDE